LIQIRCPHLRCGLVLFRRWRLHIPSFRPAVFNCFSSRTPTCGRPRWRVRVPMRSLNIFNLPNPSGRTRP
jgi:hypothetical protein